LRILKRKILDDISKKLDKAEEHVREIQEINLSTEENEKLQRFGLYQIIRMEKFIRDGGNPDFGNLDATEQTAEEFEYHLSHILNDFTPEERYRQRKEAYYFHPSYIEMEKLNHWGDRARAKYCTGQQCVPDCPYYEENGIIDDEKVVKDFVNTIEILEIEDYNKDLGEDTVNSIINDINSFNM
jgi:hypothetical protein